MVAAIMRIAAGQQGLVTRRQLLEAGISRHAIDRRLRDGLLRRVHSGVFLAGPIGGPRARELAAVLACGGGVVSHRSAAALWQILPAQRESDPVDVALNTISQRRHRAGIRVHRVKLAVGEIGNVQGLPVTTPARTLLDLSATSTADLERALAGAERADAQLRERVRELLKRYPARSGTRALRTLISDPQSGKFARSHAEELLIALLRSAQLPAFATNVRVHGYELDFYWKARRVAVEVDGYAFHSSRRAFISDRRRDVALAAAGIQVIRISYEQLTKERDRVLVQLAMALATPRP